MGMVIEVKCSCGRARKLQLDCMEFTCMCGITLIRTGAPPGTWKPKKKAKYNNKIVELDGIKFHSQLEADYYLYIKQLKTAGIVLFYILQPQYELLEKGFRSESIIYIADFFVCYKDGREIVVDTKSKGTVTKEFKLKRKLFESKYPNLTLHIIYRENGVWITDIELKAAEKLQKQAEKALLKRGVSGTHEGQSSRSKTHRIPK